MDLYIKLRSITIPRLQARIFLLDQPFLVLYDGFANGCMHSTYQSAPYILYLHHVRIKSARKQAKRKVYLKSARERAGHSLHRRVHHGM